MALFAELSPLTVNVFSFGFPYAMLREFCLPIRTAACFVSLCQLSRGEVLFELLTARLQLLFKQMTPVSLLVPRKVVVIQYILLTIETQILVSID